VAWLFRYRSLLFPLFRTLPHWRLLWLVYLTPCSCCSVCLPVDCCILYPVLLLVVIAFACLLLFVALWLLVFGERLLALHLCVVCVQLFVDYVVLWRCIVGDYGCCCWPYLLLFTGLRIAVVICYVRLLGSVVTNVMVVITLFNFVERFVGVVPNGRYCCCSLSADAFVTLWLRCWTLFVGLPLRTVGILRLICHLLLVVARHCVVIYYGLFIVACTLLCCCLNVAGLLVWWPLPLLFVPCHYCGTDVDCGRYYCCVCLAVVLIVVVLPLLVDCGFSYIRYRDTGERCVAVGLTAPC